MTTASIPAPTGAQSPFDHVRAASERIAAAADIVATAQRALEPDDSDEASVSAYGALGQAHDMLRAADNSLDLAAIADQHRGASGEREGLDDLLRGFLEVLAHVQLAEQYLHTQFDGLPEDIQTASVVLTRAAIDLDALHNEFDQWNVAHVCHLKPGAPEEVQA